MEARISLYHMVISSQENWNYEDAIRKANAVRKQLKNICEKNNYPCCVVIGVSEDDQKSGSVYANKHGQKEFRNEYGGYPFGAPRPHIHIAVYAKCACTICDRIRRNIEKKTGRRDCCNVKKHNNMDYLLYYIFSQAKKIRTITYQAEELPEGNLFTRIAYQIDSEDVKSRNPVFYNALPRSAVSKGNNMERRRINDKNNQHE